MRNFLKRKRILRLLLEGFAKRENYVGIKQQLDRVGLVDIGFSIERKFNDLTKDVLTRHRIEMFLVLTKYMIRRLGKFLDPMRRDELIRVYVDKPLEDLREKIRKGEKVSNPNQMSRVFSSIPFIAHEIIHEMLHRGSVDYFELQNLDKAIGKKSKNRNLEVEYIYDFLETVAQMFNVTDGWKESDESLWNRFKDALIRYFKEWLQKNKFFKQSNFGRAYKRFARAFDRMGESASMNKIFEKFWNLYMKSYVRNVVREDKIFKQEVEKRFNDEKGERKTKLYDFIAEELMGKVDEVFKDRFVITFDTLSKASEVLYELHDIDLKANDIIEIIKKRVLERARLMGK